MNRIVSLLIVMALNILLSSCSNETSREFVPLKNYTSIYSLISAPNRYNKKLIQTYGYAVIEFENIAIYASEKDAEYGILVNGIWLDKETSKLSQDELKKANRQWVLVEGIFDKNKKGHLGMFSGVIKNIQRIDLLKSHREKK